MYAWQNPLSSSSTLAFYLQLAEDGGHQDLGDTVRVGVGGGATILEVTVTLGGALARNADGRATVGNTVAELINGTSLVATSETELVTLAVLLDVLLVVRLKLLDGILNVLHATLNTHLLGGEVAVKAGTVPVTGDGLGVPGYAGTEILSDAGKEEASSPKVVTHLNTLARTDLELPLTRHNLSVGARDLDTGVQAGLVVGLDDVTEDNLATADTAVVRTLTAKLLGRL
jgi:hypothetical protein